MARQKLNQLVTRTDEGIESNIYVRFAPYFDILTDNDSSYFSPENFAEWYVPNKAVEDKLERLKNSRTSGVFYIVGSIGIGKSTYVRKLFNLTAVPHIDDNILRISFYFNSMALGATPILENISSHVSAAVEIAERYYSIVPTAEQLGDFVQHHRPDLLHRNRDLPKTATIAERMDSLKRRDPYAYYAEELKYLATYTDLKRIMIIVDDFESTTFNEQKEFLKNLLRFRNCLLNLGSQKRLFRVNVIFSARPPTHERHYNDEELKAWRAHPPILIREPVPLSQIFIKRFDLIRSEIGSGKIYKDQDIKTVDDLPAWEQSFDILVKVCSSLSDKYEELLVKLCNNNLSEAFNEMIELLTNMRWYDTKSRASGAFTIDEDDYKNTEAGFLRALALKNSNVYHPDIRTPLANVFRNFRNPGSDLMIIFLIRFIIADLKNSDRYSNYYPIERISDALAKLYKQTHFADHLKNNLEYLVARELLRTEEMYENGTSKLVYIPMPSLFAHWKMIPRSCIYLEMCRDDTYFAEAASLIAKGRKSDGTSYMSGVELFHSVMDFISFALDEERALWISACEAESIENVVRVFGTNSISGMMLRGLRSSLRRYYKMPINTPLAGGPVPTEIYKRCQSLRSECNRFLNDWVFTRVR